MGGIKAAIRAAKCKKLDRQYNGAMQLAKQAIIKGENAKYATSKDPAVIEEIMLRNLYYSMLDTYHSKRSFGMSVPSKRSASFWKRVAEFRTKAGVTPEEYIKAQFDWFDRTFKCAPALPCLVTEAAVTRAQSFAGRLGNVVSGAKEVTMAKAEILGYYDKQIRDICKAQKVDKAEFYRRFVKTEIHHIASVYLDNCPVWKKVSAE